MNRNHTKVAAGARRAFVGLLVVLTLHGCGDDDGDRASGYTGTYSGSATVAAGQQASVTLEVGDDGSTTGILRINTARFAQRAALPLLPVALSGSTNVQDGQFSVTGSYRDTNGDNVAVRVSGTLPSPTSAGTMTIEIGGQSYSGAFTPPPATATVAAATATRTRPAGATATRTSVATHTPGGPTTTPTPSPSPSQTPGGQASPTPTQGVINGVDSRFFGAWGGSARNESTGVQKQVRIRIALQGSNVVVTDLGGNLYKTGGSTLTMTAPSPGSLIHTTTGSPLVSFSLTLSPNDTLAGLYQVTTLGLPPIIDAVGLTLTRES